jgi:hypothetical protein
MFLEQNSVYPVALLSFLVPGASKTMVTPNKNYECLENHNHLLNFLLFESTI